MTDSISPESIEWALSHVRKYSDNDLFPKPFEFEAIVFYWQKLKPELIATSPEKWGSRPTRRFLVPKSHRPEFRVVTQLDPLDSLLYLALVHEHADVIEQNRVSPQVNIAFSYRLSPDPNGRLFEAGSSYSAFQERSVELANEANWVLVADVADFYNQVSHHAVQRELESAGIDTRRASNIETFLGRLTAKQSRGLAVGPPPSIVLAEAVMNDVDNRLVSRGFRHVRFVDDIRVFCKSQNDAYLAAHELASYLHTAHRLSLNPRKTKILTTERFVVQEVERPEEEEQEKRMSHLKELVGLILSATGYAVSVEDLGKEHKGSATREALKSMFDNVIKRSPPRYGVLKYLLRRARDMRTVVLQSRVLSNLETLAPLAPEALSYLVATTKDHLRPKVGRAIVRFMTESRFGAIPYVRLWCLESLTQHRELVEFDEARKLAELARTELGIRPLALLALTHGDVAWVRAEKEHWSGHSPWDRRALLLASRVLPATERRHWLGLVKDTATDALDVAVAAWLLQPKSPRQTVL